MDATGGIYKLNSNLQNFLENWTRTKRKWGSLLLHPEDKSTAFAADSNCVAALQRAEIVLNKIP